MSQPKPTPKKPTPLELLSGLANDLQALAKEFDQRIQPLAAHAKDIALVIEQQRETDAAQLAKLRQLLSPAYAQELFDRLDAAEARVKTLEALLRDMNKELHTGDLPPALFERLDKAIEDLQ